MPACDERGVRRDRLAAAGAEVVEHDDLVTGVEQQPADDAADVSGAPGDEQFHVVTFRTDACGRAVRRVVSTKNAHKSTGSNIRLSARRAFDAKARAEADTMALMSDADRRPRVLSGIQPTADSFHLGNYLGAVRNWVAMQDTARRLLLRGRPARDHRRARPGAAAPAHPGRRSPSCSPLGLDPERCTLFVQSHVPEHAQLAWVLSCITGFGEASRMTQFKDKSAKQGADRASVGLFTYPILQAADILLYQADAVPVGEDQRQHLELTRDLAQRFNTRFGTTFTVPVAAHRRDTAKITDLQDPTAKMSQVGVLAARHHRAARGAGPVGQEDQVGGHRHRPGDPLRRGEQARHLQPAHHLRGADRPHHRRAGRGSTTASGYGDLKKDLAEVVVEFVKPIQERTRAYLDDPAQLDKVLAVGAEKARAVSRGHPAHGVPARRVSSARPARGLTRRGRTVRSDAHRRRDRHPRARGAPMLTRRRARGRRPAGGRTRRRT